MPHKRPKATKSKLTEQAVALAEFAATALAAADQSGSRTKAIGKLHLTDAERGIAAELPGLPLVVQKKLQIDDGSITVAETAGIVLALAEALADDEPLEQFRRLLVGKKLTDRLRNVLTDPAASKVGRSKPTGGLYQFKITLLDAKPPIWRRILVKDGSLDDLHEHIQTAMGWTNSHLHHFRIKEQLYGDPELVAENFEDMGYRDSTTTLLSDILPPTEEGFAFQGGRIVRWMSASLDCRLPTSASSSP
jgi:hypothetical protein